jgi:uncharacterized protein YaaN involved in tellurite resistance
LLVLKEETQSNIQEEKQLDRRGFRMSTMEKVPLQTVLNRSLEVKHELMPVEIEEKKAQVIEKVKNSPEIQQIIRQIDLNNAQSLLTFGSHSAEEVSRFADTILRSMEKTKADDAGKLIMQLDKIMEKFDIKDFEKQGKPGLLDRIFHRAKNSIESLFRKYHSMGEEVDKIFITLKEYEAEINKTNRELEEMFEKNLFYYEELQKYIIAGEMAIEELTTKLIPEWEQHAMKTGDKLDQMTVQNLYQAKEMLEQRVYDLRLAENIALQSMPMIKSIQYGNYNLVRKINSAFIITLPIFKQCLAQAIMLKRQAIQAKAVKALDERTNELILRNAQNTALQTKLTAQLASGSFVSIETLEKTWQTIMQGIEETKQIQLESQRQREENTRRLEEFKKAFEEKRLLK